MRNSRTFKLGHCDLAVNCKAMKQTSTVNSLAITILKVRIDS